MNEQLKQEIDNADYESLLCRWRFAPIGDPLFYGEIGEYYSKVMLSKREATPDNGVSASKKVGWDK